MSQLNENIKKEKLSNTEDKDVNSPNKAPRKSNKTSPTKAGAFSIGFVEQIELIVIAFAAIVLLFSFVFRTCQVSGPSMENTLIDGETVIVSKLFYTPKKGDIVVFHQTGTDQDDLNKPIVKRVIGVPGDYITVKHYSNTMSVTIKHSNGDVEVITEPYIKYEGKRTHMYDVNNLLVEEGTVFVMGDNRSNSTDSRDGRIGLVDTREILGKVIFRIAPLSRMGTVK